jgi:hypothetical protein
MWYVPSRSYLRMRLKLELKDGRTIHGTTFNIGNSPAAMNQLYLAMLDPLKFNAMATALMSNASVLAAYNEYLSLVEAHGPIDEDDLETRLKDVRDAVALFLRNGSRVSGSATIDAGKIESKGTATSNGAALFTALGPLTTVPTTSKDRLAQIDGEADGAAQFPLGDAKGVIPVLQTTPAPFSADVTVTNQADIKFAFDGYLWPIANNAPDFYEKWAKFLRYNCLPAIAPAHCGAANFFSSLTLTYGGQVVSSINSHVVQVDAFDKRTSFTSQAFERDGLGNVNNFYAPDFVDRCVAVTSDYIEFLWQPPLAFFRFPHAVPSGDFRLNMTVDPKWRSNAFQVVGVKLDGTRMTENDYDVSLMELTMWNHFVQGPSTERAAFVLDLDNIVCQAQQSLGEERLNRQFDISPDSTCLALAHTDMTPGPYHSSRSLFRFPRRRETDANTSVVLDLSDDVLPYSLNQYQLLFDGKQWPQQQGDPMPNWQTTGNNHLARLVQQYHETHTQTGLAYNSCGPETYQQFTDAGMLLFTTWPRANSNATRVALNEVLVDAKNWQQRDVTDILLFTKFKRSFLIRIENGRVMRVETAQNTTDATLTG